MKSSCPFGGLEYEIQSPKICSSIEFIFWPVFDPVERKRGSPVQLGVLGAIVGCSTYLQAVTSWTLSIEDISDGRPNFPYFLTDARTVRRNIAQVADSTHNSCRPK